MPEIIRKKIFLDVCPFFGKFFRLDTELSNSYLDKRSSPRSDYSLQERKLIILVVQQRAKKKIESKCNKTGVEKEENMAMSLRKENLPQ